MRPSRAALIEVLIAFMAITLFVSIIRAEETPQCNLPGWGVKKTTTVFATRAPRGHTHTCVNGHTWDHEANHGHQCQFCGAIQYVQDRSPRPVTVTRTVVVNASAPPASSPPPARIVQASPVYFLPRSSAGCANGQCAVPR